MKQITMLEAQKKMFDLLKEKDMGDTIYEAAQAVFQDAINAIETGNEIIDKDELDTGQEWYDEIQEEFYYAVYDKLAEFLRAK